MSAFLTVYIYLYFIIFKFFEIRETVFLCVIPLYLAQYLPHGRYQFGKLINKWMDVI